MSDGTKKCAMCPNKFQNSRALVCSDECRKEKNRIEKQESRLRGLKKQKLNVVQEEKAGVIFSDKTSTSIKRSEEQQQKKVVTTATTVKEPSGLETTTSHTQEYIESKTVTLEIMQTVERCEESYVQHIQHEQLVQISQSPLQNLPAPDLAKVLSMKTTKGSYQPPPGAEMQLMLHCPEKGCKDYYDLTILSKIENTKKFLERMLYLGAVPPECSSWELIACKKMTTYWDPGCFNGISSYEQMFENKGWIGIEKEHVIQHISNKRNDIASEDAWRTCWLDLTVSEGVIYLPGYFALHIFKDNQYALRIVQSAMQPDSSDIMRQILPDPRASREEDISTATYITLEDGSEKEYLTASLNHEKLQPLRNIAYRQAKERKEALEKGWQDDERKEKASEEAACNAFAKRERTDFHQGQKAIKKEAEESMNQLLPPCWPLEPLINGPVLKKGRKKPLPLSKPNW
jgi:hypothetical protein